MLRIETGMHTAAIKCIDTDAAGRWAVTASHDKTARVWDVVSGKLQRVLRPPIGPGDEGKLYAVAISPDGAVVAAAGWTEGNTIYLFERATGKLLSSFTGLPNVIIHLAFSPDGRWLAASLGGSNGVRVWDWRRGGAPLADSAYGGSSNGASWSADGRLVVSSDDGKLRLYRPQGGALTRLAEAPAPGGRPFGVAFAPDGRGVAVGYNGTARVDVLDGETLALRFSPDTGGVNNGDLSSVAWSRDGQTLAAGGVWSVEGKKPVRRWPDAGRGRALDTHTTRNTITGLTSLPGGGWLVGAGDPAWGVLSADGAWQGMAAAPIADLRGSRGGAFLLDAVGARLQFGYEQWGKPAHQFDVRRRQLSAGALVGGAAPRIAGLVVDDWINTTAPKLGGKPLALRQYETSRSLAITPDASGFALGSQLNLRLFTSEGRQSWELPVPDEVWGVNIPSEGRVVVAAYGDGTIRWHRLSDGKELLAFFPHADRRRWVLWTPSGYYDASPGAEELIGWHVNRGADAAADFFPASRFRSRFYRPDVIDRVLDTLDEAEALRQADLAANRRQEAPVSVARVLPPAVDLLSPAELGTSSPTVLLRARGRSAADAPVTGWRVRVNGQAVSDARDFAAAMRRQQGKLYRQVEVKLLTDAQATADAVVDGLEWLRKQVTQHDMGMIFISGHGVNDPAQGYTYLPVNADPERLRRTGVAMDEFKKTLAGLPGKALFFFDTCHSGNVLGGKQARALPNDVSGVINELASAENGVVVFSSSTGRQLSYEDAAWGNGAFTKALVEGLDGAADYQKNGRITHKMLDLYISERVKALTKGRQSPVTQAPGGVPDFPLAVVK